MTTHAPIDEPIDYSATRVNALPVSGRWLVDTETDTYDVDVDARLAVRLNLDAEGRGEVGVPEPFMFDTVEAYVGDALLFDADGSPRVTDRVLGITRGGAA